MGKRETYSGALLCKCGNKGTGQYEENENPVHNQGRLDTVILSSTEGFRVKNDSIYCDQCGEKV